MRILKGCQGCNDSGISVEAQMLHMLEICSIFNSTSAKYFASADAHIAEVGYILAGVGFTCGISMECGGTQSIIASLSMEVRT